MLRRAVFGFIGGFVATLVFHQIALAILHAVKFTDRAPWSMKPVPPWGVPAVISLAFWGGVWGVIMILALAKTRHLLVASTIFGAILPTLVAGLVVAPLKHQPIPHSPRMFALGLIVNAAWGFGTALIYRLLAGKR